MKRSIKILAALVLVAVLAAAAFFFLPAGLDEVTASSNQPKGQELIERGRYLATAGDCIACHSVAGGGAYAGGLAFKLPFGTIYSSNITPDKETGIGDWSDAEFVRAMRHGVGKNGEDLYPAFPYTSYALMSTDDMLAVKAYLFSLPAVRAQTAENSLSFPYNQRYLMRAWKLLFLPKETYQAEAKQSEEWNRGAYLVEALGHCGECHTPRNLMYGLDSGKKFAGAVTQGWKAYNITSDKDGGIGNWSVEELTSYLHTGHAEGRGAATGSMAEAIDLSLRHLTEQDIRSMAVYLKTIPPQPTDAAAKVDPNPPLMAASQAYAPAAQETADRSLGLTIFESACASCHAWNGEGQQSPYAALRGSQTVNDPDGTNLVQVILQGSHMTTPQGSAFMPAFADAYSDVEIAALSNYVLGHFGNKKASVTPEDVAAARNPSQ
ncbi:c-type cytochrome [Rhizobium deserti]|uniref:C-type cytochrome n=1 Tax=Rhizobium deserti TaxID=2547961 RepID=A0A4R5UHX8_9HYPH|nr:cytochrome c [Rhizobium deserti]TDK35573.1 c-type cytochrome [Rhizobium deserti]